MVNEKVKLGFTRAKTIPKAFKTKRTREGTEAKKRLRTRRKGLKLRQQSNK
jgi:hypothetical protein